MNIFHGFPRVWLFMWPCARDGWIFHGVCTAVSHLLHLYITSNGKTRTYRSLFNGGNGTSKTFCTRVYCHVKYIPMSYKATFFQLFWCHKSPLNFQSISKEKLRSVTVMWEIVYFPCNFNNMTKILHGGSV